jgi:hypothetical protein
MLDGSLTLRLQNPGHAFFPHFTAKTPQQSANSGRFWSILADSGVC